MTMTDEQPEQWAVKEIETVTGDFQTESGAPFYRIEIDGYCADFDYREAAENFAAAIQRAFAEREAELDKEIERQEGLVKIYRQAQLSAEAKLCREQANAKGWKKRAEFLETQLAALKSREASHG